MPSSNIKRVCAVATALCVVSLAGAASAQDDRYSRNDSYQPDDSQERYDDRRGGDNSSNRGGDSYSRSAPRDDANSPPAENYDRAPRDQGSGRSDSFSDRRGGGSGYGDAYAPPPPRDDRDSGYPEARGPSHYEEGEIVAAGHSFFGAVSKGLAGAVEYAFKSQGRPNGYILGEDASGAFVVGLRYGEGKLFTKDAGTHKVYWQGPSLGYDFGGEGSKTMVLVYNIHNPDQIFNRFGGAEGSAYLVGGVSVQFQTNDNVTLAVIRSGVGLRLGANVGYSKYSRSPTWNPL